MVNGKNDKQPKHSGFEAQPKFEIIPKGYIKKRNKDGTISFVPPTKKSSK